MTMMDGVDDMNSNTDEEESEDETDSEGDVQGRGEDMENDGGNKRMVEKLFTNNIIKSQEVLSVMKQVNRGNYVRQVHSTSATSISPLPTCTPML